MGKSSLVTSPKVTCYINGVDTGRVTGFRWTSDTPRNEIFALDSVTPYEEAPTICRCTGSLNLLRTINDGGIEAIGMTAHSSQMVREMYFTLTLIERTTDTLLFRADYCSVINQTWSVEERSIVRGVVNFSGLYWNNECGLSES